MWGLFKKIVIADNCAEYANMFFNNPGEHQGSGLFLGALFFTMQIYCDFSGYSDIALGTARLFGIELLKNFAFPYFSRDIAEFWRRWHISLSSWFRDYLYIPLGGSKGGTWMKVRNTFIIFIVSGFWHGANWTFIIWGTLNAIYFLPLLLGGKNRTHLDIIAQGKTFPNSREFFNMILTFLLTVIAWIFFRAQNVDQAFHFISKIFSPSLFSIPDFEGRLRSITIIIIVFVFLLFEWNGRHHQYAIAKFGIKWKRPIRYLFYYGLIIATFWFAGKQQEFIYFQF
ncbi:MAG: hypothetical protein MUE71_10250 [Chitinophagaceae bacterium]|nr:hypothetical protein [Chitinophagaceae bacterium]